MSRPLPRYTDTRIADEQKLAAILVETGDVAPPPANEPLREALTKPGDIRKLRGIPCIARGVRGGVDPYLAVQHWPQR